MPPDLPTPAHTSQRKSVPRGVWAVLLGVGCLGALALFASDPMPGLLMASIRGNLREVDPGRFYRAGQLTGTELADTIDTLGVRTVINLRGHSTDHAWYSVEAGVAEQRGVALHNIHLSSHRLPRTEEVATLLSLYRTAERPILVHCFGGADRAGEASALYQIEHMGKTPEEALAMLTLRQRHLAWLRPAKRRFIEQYQGEDWLLTSYDPCAAEIPAQIRPSTCSKDASVSR